MDLAYYLPSPPWRSLLSAHAVVATARAESDFVPALLPNLHVVVSGTLSYGFADGRVVTAAPVTVLGPTSRSFTVRLGEGTVLVVAGILPLGWSRLVRQPASVLVDDAVDAAQIWPPGLIPGLLDRMNSMELDGTHVHVIEAFLQAHLGSNSDDSRIGCIDHWLECTRGLSLDRLRADLDLCPRQVGRLTVARYGLGPKQLAMKYRSLRAATALTVGGPSALDIATAGFADQSHFTRDFHRFIGCTPGTFLRDHRQVAAVTLEGRWRAGVDRRLALWS